MSPEVWCLQSSKGAWCLLYVGAYETTKGIGISYGLVPTKLQRGFTSLVGWCLQNNKGEWCHILVSAQKTIEGIGVPCISVHIKQQR